MKINIKNKKIDRLVFNQTIGFDQYLSLFTVYFHRSVGIDSLKGLVLACV